MSDTPSVAQAWSRIRRHFQACEHVRDCDYEMLGVVGDVVKVVAPDKNADLVALYIGATDRETAMSRQLEAATLRITTMSSALSRVLDLTRSSTLTDPEIRDEVQKVAETALGLKPSLDAAP